MKYHGTPSLWLSQSSTCVENQKRPTGRYSASPSSLPHHTAARHCGKAGIDENASEERRLHRKRISMMAEEEQDGQLGCMRALDEQEEALISEQQAYIRCMNDLEVDAVQFIRRTGDERGETALNELRRTIDTYIVSGRQEVKTGIELVEQARERVEQCHRAVESAVQEAVSQPRRSMQ